VGGPSGTLRRWSDPGDRLGEVRRAHLPSSRWPGGFAAGTSPERSPPARFGERTSLVVAVALGFGAGTSLRELGGVDEGEDEDVDPEAPPFGAARPARGRGGARAGAA
jgi:hypothetical protein